MGDEKPRDKCGIFGYFGEDKASERVYLGLHNIQHRGQESCGICSWDGEAYQKHLGMGIVNDVFDKDLLDKLNGHMAIGHVRYSTQGESNIQNAQPILYKGIAIAHNGEIENYRNFKRELESEGEEFKTSSDTEIFLHLIGRASGGLEERIAKTASVMAPSYAMVIMGQEKMIGIRDPEGVKPLELGKTKSGYVLSSETVGFDIIDAKYLREVKPGEMVVIDSEGLHSHRLSNDIPESRCIFEMIYFSRPDSLISSDVSVGMVRREFGRELYKQNPISADVVIEVPDSSFDAAMGISLESGIPYDKGLNRSHYIGRTFIEPSQELIEAAILKKFNVHEAIVRGKRVILTDDSLVRGNTLSNLVRFIKDKGAKEVHVMISSPPYIESCNRGIDTADKKRLIARHKTIDEIREHIQADSLTYLEQSRMLANPLLKDRGFCTYCFDGKTLISSEIKNIAQVVSITPQ